MQWNLDLNITNLHFPRPKCPKALLERMHKKCTTYPKKPKTYIIPEFARNPRGQKCKIPIVRSPSPALFAWNLHLNVTNLHFPRPKCPKALIERMHKRMYNLQKKAIKTHITPEILGDPRWPKCKIPFW